MSLTDNIFRNYYLLTFDIGAIMALAIQYTGGIEYAIAFVLGGLSYSAVALAKGDSQ